MNLQIDLDAALSFFHSNLSKQVENFFVRPGIYHKQSIEPLDDLRFSRELYSYHLPLLGRSSSTDDQLK